MSRHARYANRESNPVAALPPVVRSRVATDTRMGSPQLLARDDLRERAAERFSARISPNLARQGTESLRGRRGALPTWLRAPLEAQLTTDLHDVQVHADSAGAEVAAAFDARAVTAGRDVFVGSGELAQGASEGVRLLAHELVHVAQQRESGPFIGRQPRGPQPRRTSPAPGSHDVLDDDFRLAVQRVQDAGVVVGMERWERDLLLAIHTVLTGFLPSRYGRRDAHDFEIRPSTTSRIIVPIVTRGPSRETTNQSAYCLDLRLYLSEARSSGERGRYDPPSPGQPDGVLTLFVGDYAGGRDLTNTLIHEMTHLFTRLHQSIRRGARGGCGPAPTGGGSPRATAGRATAMRAPLSTELAATGWLLTSQAATNFQTRLRADLLDPLYQTLHPETVARTDRQLIEDWCRDVVSELLAFVVAGRAVDRLSWPAVVLGDGARLEGQAPDAGAVGVDASVTGPDAAGRGAPSAGRSSTRYAGFDFVTYATLSFREHEHVREEPHLSRAFGVANSAELRALYDAVVAWVTRHVSDGGLVPYGPPAAAAPLPTAPSRRR